MEMVKLCSYFLLIKCLGSSAWPERCLGKAKVAGSIPAQGFLLNPIGSQFELHRKYTSNETLHFQLDLQTIVQLIWVFIRDIFKRTLKDKLLKRDYLILRNIINCK